MTSRNWPPVWAAPVVRISTTACPGPSLHTCGGCAVVFQVRGRPDDMRAWLLLSLLGGLGGAGPGGGAARLLVTESQLDLLSQVWAALHCTALCCTAVLQARVEAEAELVDSVTRAGQCGTQVTERSDLALQAVLGGGAEVRGVGGEGGGGRAGAPDCRGAQHSSHSPALHCPGGHPAPQPLHRQCGRPAGKVCSSRSAEHYCNGWVGSSP